MAKAPAQHTRPRVGGIHTAPRQHRATDTRRGSARERGYSTAWDKFSRAFLRSNPLCEYCLGNGKTVAAEVTDHDIPHRGDPELFWNNSWTACCVSCHSGLKARLEARYSGDELLEQIARRKGKR